MAEAQTVVEGVVERLVHVGVDGYTVAVLTIAEREHVRVAGKVLLGLQPGETVRVRGGWGTDSGYPSTLRVAECERVLPATVHAIRCYLGSGLVRGIGPKLADAIVDHFAQDTLTVIDRTPRRLLEVHQIGPERLAKIVAAWAEQRAVREVMVFLQGVGVSPTLAVRIHKKLGAQSLRVVQQEPYRLVEEVRGIGFATADRIALAVGIPEQSPERIKAALLHTLDQARAMAGHCYLPHDTLIDNAAALVCQESEFVRGALQQLRKKRKVVIEGTPGGAPGDAVVFLAWLHRAETMLADNLVRHLHAPSQMPGRARFSVMADTWPFEDTTPSLDPRQLAAVRMALTQTVSILTGGPGCGKSFTIREVAVRARAAGAKVTLAAPTGRAAKRLSELTGLSAMTVHRLVRPRPAPDTDGSLFDPGDALQADLIVVDEASMLDLPLADELVSRIPPGCHLLLVGDVDQLPSVGPGCVLRDLLNVPQIPSVHLERVYRQGTGSSITANADRVRRGLMPTNSAEFWFVPVEDAEAIAETVVDIATRRLPAAYDVEPGGVQVLCPGRGKHAGAVNLGRLIQEKLNPHRGEQPQHWADDRAFRIGDKVMPTRNNYDKGRQGVFNGSSGTVTALDMQQRRLDVRLDDGETVSYDFDELDDLAHAFAITVHRSQGSEYPYVVVPLSTASGPFLLQRNLLYTAITRAKTMVVVVGEPAALRMALRQEVQRRNTGLLARLCEQPHTSAFCTHNAN